MNEEEKKILSVQDILHLQSDKHVKNGISASKLDTSKYVLNQKPKAKAVRNFISTVNITDEQRRQFSQGDTAPNHDAVLAEKARHAMEIAGLHAKEEAIEHAKTAAEKPIKTANGLAKEIRAGNFDFSFGALIEGSDNLKETI